MDKIRFLSDASNIYDAEISYVSDHVIALKMNIYPADTVYTSGFEVLNENNFRVMGDYSKYVTVYRLLSTGVIQLSNDGSKYVEPKPSVVYRDITTSIVWDDANNADGLRPASVTVTLVIDGVNDRSVVLSNDNEWTHTFEHLDASHAYDITVKNIPNYIGDISGYTITETHETIDSIKLAKIRELNSACTAGIENGADVELSTGIEHFNFTSYVQTNIATAYNAAMALINTGHKDETVPFYNSNNECELYSASDIMVIYFTMGSLQTYLITLAHQLENQIHSMTSVDDIKAITLNVESLDADHTAKFAEIIAKSEEIVEILKKSMEATE